MEHVKRYWWDEAVLRPIEINWNFLLPTNTWVVFLLTNVPGVLTELAIFSLIQTLALSEDRIRAGFAKNGL